MRTLKNFLLFYLCISSMFSVLGCSGGGGGDSSSGSYVSNPVSTPVLNSITGNVAYNDGSPAIGANVFLYKEDSNQIILSDTVCDAKEVSADGNFSLEIRQAPGQFYISVEDYNNNKSYKSALFYLEDGYSYNIVKLSLIPETNEVKTTSNPLRLP